MRLFDRFDCFAALTSTLRLFDSSTSFSYVACYSIIHYECCYMYIYILLNTFVTYFSASFSYYFCWLAVTFVRNVVLLLILFLLYAVFHTYYFSGFSSFFRITSWRWSSCTWCVCVFFFFFFYFGFNINVVFPFIAESHMDDWSASKCTNSSCFIVLIIRFVPILNQPILLLHSSFCSFFFVLFAITWTSWRYFVYKCSFFAVSLSFSHSIACYWSFFVVAVVLYNGGRYFFFCFCRPFDICVLENLMNSTT